jgi:hypothetical protein
MLNTFKKIMVAGALMLATALVPTTAAAQDGMRTFTVFNNSRYRINQMYVSPSSYPNWGNDKLGNEVFPPTYRFDLSVYPGWYDVKLVDQDGDTCVIKGVDFRDGESWNITDGVLVACELFSSN